MKKAFALLIIISVFLTVGGAFASQVTNVELNYSNGSTHVRIDVNGTVRFSHQTVVAKDGKPFRVIIDVLSATHELGAKNFWALPNCPVKGLRTSQYSVKPEKVVRLVFDMKKETFYQVNSDEKSVTISFPDKSNKVFPVWSTSYVVSELKKSQAQEKQVIVRKEEPASDKKTPIKEKTWAEKNSSMDQDRQLSLQGTESKTKKTSIFTPKISKPVNINKDIPKQPLFDENNLPPLVQNQALSLNSVNNEKKQTPINNKPAVKNEEKTVVAKVEQKTTTKSVKAKPEKPITTVAKAEPVIEQHNVPLLKKEEAKTQPSKKETKSTPNISTKQTKFASNTEVKSEPKPKSNIVSKPAVKKTEIKKEVSDSKGTKKENSEVKKDKKADKKSTSRFRRSPSSPTKIKGTLVAQFPQRLVIKYKSYGRDPFETLINESRTYDNPIEQRIANVEGLRLVGIIESDDKSNSALFEDNDGYGYILKEGDKVRKGYVLRIEPEKVYFQIFEYGWSRTLSLKMEY